MFESYISILSKFGVPEWLSSLVWPVFPFVGVLFMSLFFGVVFLVLMERRTLALLTVRKGPNRVGYDGLFQSFADGLKIMFKEDIISEGSDAIIFSLAPIIVLATSIMVYAVIPFTSNMLASSIPVGMLFLLAVFSLHTLALVLAGWASNNKYSLLGGLRSAAQAISYEIPLVIVAISVVVLSGSLNLNDIVQSQEASTAFSSFVYSLAEPFTNSSVMQVVWERFLTPLLNWNLWNYNCFANFAGCFVFLICAIAEVNRIPFDLPEAESELVSGFSTEYSGMKFAMFFMAEYVSLFAIALFTSTLFFGGYLSLFNDYVVNIFLSVFPLVENILMKIPYGGGCVFIEALVHLEQAAWIIFKSWFLIFTAMLIRATLPRLRVDQMMGLCWKFLLPIALFSLLWVTVLKEVSHYTQY